MKTTSFKSAVFAAAVFLLAATLVSAAPHENRRSRPTTLLEWDNLQSDIAGVAALRDPNVVNPWGIAISPFGNVWVVDNGTGVATVYSPDGRPLPSRLNPLVVTIPASATNAGGANPTGIVFNPTQFFKVSNGTNTLPAQFIFVSEDGVISGWNQQLNNAQAFIAVDNGAALAVYKGVTRGFANGHNFIYVANFYSSQVETYDENFVLQAGFPFSDPNLPAGFAPFNIRNFNGQIFVTYAKQDVTMHDDVPGAGNGFVNVFDTKGQFLRRLVSNGALNSPWGMEFINGNIWIGNFGDGVINVYNPNNGNSLGSPKDIFGNPLTFDGLWALVLDPGGLYFSAGIVDEAHGLFGVITPAD